MRYSVQSPSVRYQILDCVGQGQSADVFRALRIDLVYGMHQKVAIKVLKNQELVDVWRREFQSLASIKSRFCVQIFGFECLDRGPALILEYIDGCSLAALTTDLTEDQVVEILGQIQMGLADLHQQGLFHGDLSPHNIMIDINGHVRLVDFGLGNTHPTGNSATVEFAAPEVLTGYQPCLASDLYSLARLEAHLRRQLMISGPPMLESYLARDPDRRVPLALSAERPDVREQIGQRVRKRQAERPPRAMSSTDRLPSTRRRLARGLAHGLAAVTALALLAMTPHGASLPPTGFQVSAAATLSVRTKNWYRVQINGKEAGYTPLTGVAVTAGLVTVSWQGARGRGQHTLTLDQGQNTVLTDSFFEH